jgi:mannitol-1-phosphate 5-dehydrogenase
MKKSFVQYGAGNIGRGFIGQIFSRAGFKVKFIDVNMDFINALNNEKRYPINIVSKNNSKEIWVENVCGINGMDIESVAQAIAECDMMATAVGVNILPRIVPALISGFRRRIEIGNPAPLNIIICENLIDADKLLHKLISEKLTDEEKIIFNENVGLVEASIGRMVPVMTEEQRQGNILRVCVEGYCELPIDKAAFKGDIPKVEHLFPFSPFEFYIKRKLFVHNMGHALTAYLGALTNCEYIYEAIDNPYIKIIVSRAMNESALALSKRFGVPLCDIEEHISDLLIRFSNRALGDTVLRVGRDTLRKLSSYDRFAGAIKLCEEMNISTVYISLGIAAGLFFNCPDDSGTESVNRDLCENGIDYVLKNLCEIADNLSALNFIKTYFEQIIKTSNLSELLKIAEQNEEIILKAKNVI